MEISLTIDRQCPAKARPRLGRNKVFDSQSAQKHIWRALLLQSTEREAIKAYLDDIVSVSVTCEFGMKIPGAISKRKAEVLDGQFHTKKPDIDNLLKWVFDVGNGILWPDDNCISKCVALKQYTKTPYTRVIVTGKLPV